ncbi:hypothetical protein F5Y13DRAFT_168637 [Hypoxylon sp. FL1857]|nr:hypothetical protein F5Y13DRAFT_168637 [Hypoxylon sp. FL1857]
MYLGLLLEFVQCSMDQLHRRSANGLEHEIGSIKSNRALGHRWLDPTCHNPASPNLPLVLHSFCGYFSS